MVGTSLKWLGVNLGILLILVAVWLIGAGLILSQGDLAKILSELPWALFLYFGAFLIPATLVLLVVARLARYLAGPPLRIAAVALSPLILVAFVPNALTSSEIAQPALYLLGGLSLSVTFGLLMRLPEGTRGR